MTKILILSAILFIFAGCGASMTKKDMERLKQCASIVEKKNNELLVPPAVGNWKNLHKVTAEFIGKEITIIYYYKKGGYTDKNKKGLDMMQHAFVKQAGCNSDEFKTIVTK